MSATVDHQDVQAVLETHSLARIQAIQLFLAFGMLVAGYAFFKTFQLQAQEGWALMQDMPWFLPLLTLVHAGFAYFVYRRYKRFFDLQWKSGTIDPQAVARLGWRSAPTRTPTEVSIFLIEASLVLPLGAFGWLALAGLGVLWIGVETSDLLKRPWLWINVLSYLYWWRLWFRSYATRSRALRFFRRHAPGEAFTIQVASEPTSSEA